MSSCDASLGIISNMFFCQFFNLLLLNINCPNCDTKQLQKPIKTWTYGKLIIKRTVKGTTWGASITCSQYFCKKCQKKFNHYTSKNKSWSIPKSKTNK